MSIDERLRLNIHTKLSDLLGSDEADALVHMFSVPWHDVATKEDLRVLSSDLRADTAELRTDLHKNSIGQTRWLTGCVSALAAVMLTIAQLLG